MGFFYHDSRMHKFSHFLPYSQGNFLMLHANETNKLWHDIFGNLNYSYLQALSKEIMVEGLPTIKFSLRTFKGCIMGKHVEHKYDKGKERMDSEVLDLIHSYLIGPLNTPSYGNSRYVFTFIDDFPRYS